MHTNPNMDTIDALLGRLEEASDRKSQSPEKSIQKYDPLSVQYGISILAFFLTFFSEKYKKYQMGYMQYTHTFIMSVLNSIISYE